MTEQHQPAFYGWTNAALLFSIYLVTVGLSFYGFSTIFPAMIEAMHWSRGDAAVAHTLNVLLTGLLTPVLALLLNRFGSKKILGAGAIILFTGLIGLGIFTTKIWHWVLLWGILIPFGLCFAGLISIQFTIVFWFDIKRATVLGIVMSGAAVGGFIAQPTLTWLIGRTGTWQAGWLAAAVFALIGLILSFWIRNKPADMGQYPDGINPGVSQATAGSSGRPRTYRTPHTWALQDAIQTRVLYLILAIMIGHIMSIFMITTHGVLHLTDAGYTKMQAASVLSLTILGSGIARFPMGWLADRIEPRLILTAAIALMLGTLIGIWKAPTIISLMMFGPVFGFCYGTGLVMFPAIVANYFGPNAFASINGFLVPIMIPFGASVPAVAGYIADRFGNYDPAFLILIVLLLGGVLCALLLKPPARENNPGEVK